MAINQEIYGDSTDWADYWHGMCKCTDYTLWSKVSSGDWELNQLIDNSVCYFGAIGNFYAANPIALLPDNAQCNVFEESEINNMVFILQDNSLNEGWKYEYFNITGTSNKWSEWENVSDLPNYSPEANTKTLFNFKLNKLLFIPYVRASTTDDVVPNSSEFFSLAEWIDTEHANYPYLCTVYMIPYYNRGTDELPEWVSAEVDSDHYVYTQRNAFFSDDFKNIGDGDVSSTYCFGGVPTKKQWIMIMGFRDSWFEIATEKPIGFDPDITHYKFNSDFTRVRYCRQYSQALIDDIYTQIAFYGVFFLGLGTESFANISLTSDRVYLGTIEEGGYTKGNYTHGEANADQPQFTWEDTSESEYDPNAKVDPNSYDDGFNFPAAFGLGISGINNRYLLTATNILTLSNTLWDFTKNLQPEEVVDNISQTFLTNNPIDLIVSLQYLPVKDIAFGTASAVKLGRLDLGVSATSVLAANTYDCGFITIFPTFGDNWISKNIRIFAYLPFCGTVEVDLEAAMNHELYLKYLVDTYTGSCTAVLYIINSKGKIVVLNTADGNCITDIPITGIQWETLNANLYNAYQQNKQLKLNNTFGIAKALTGFGSSVGVGDPVGALIGGLNFAGTFTGAMTAEKISDYNLSHTQIPMRAIGGSSGITSNLLDMTPKLLFYRPIDKGTESFIETEGLSCILNGTLSGLQLSGYTEISKIDLNGIAATAAEKDMIRSLLASGVYV